MILQSAAHGARRSLRQPALATTLWLWTLLLALIVALPASVFFGAAFDLSPEADQLLEGFRVRFMEEAVQYDRSPSGALIWAAAAAVAGLALLGNAFFSGGVIEILATSDERPFLHRFMRGAGHFFGRFLRLLVVSFLAAAAGVVTVLLFVAPIGSLVSGARSEWLQLFAGALVPAGIAAVAALATVVLDYARIQMALSGGRSALVAWWAGTKFVVRRFGGVLLIAAIYLGAVLLLYGLSLAYQLSAPSNTGLLIGVLLVLQQATIWARWAIRVGSYAAQIEYYRAAAPAAPASALAVPAPAALSSATAADAERLPTA